MAVDGRGKQLQRGRHGNSTGSFTLGPNATSGPITTFHDTHFKIAARLRLMVLLCAHDTRCPCAPATTGAMRGTSMEPLAYRALLCSRAQMSWRHDVISELWQSILQ